MGVGEGERVAIVSPNAARFLVSLFGVSVFGRVLVPVNFRLNPEEIRYIIEHSGSTVALIDPELEEVCGRSRSSTASSSARRATPTCSGAGTRARATG